MCHHHADALDLTQSTFIRALEHIDRFRTDANFYTWLFRIAMNLSISHRRRGRLRQVRALPDDDVGPAARAPAGAARSAPEQAIKHEEQARLADALQQLEVEYRAAVVLKDIENLDYATIAEILGVPVGTVKSRIHRGRGMLRDLLRDDVVDDDRA
jgi:RNA polymerase sigma-70 factor, ECF subfamily